MFFLDGHYLCINGLVDADSLKNKKWGWGRGKEDEMNKLLTVAETLPDAPPLPLPPMTPLSPQTPVSPCPHAGPAPTPHRGGHLNACGVVERKGSWWPLHHIQNVLPCFGKSVLGT